MAFLRGLLETKAAGSAVSRAIAGRGSVTVAAAYVGRWDLEKAVRDGYEKVIWVYRCVDAIASNASSIPIVVRNGDQRDGQIVNDSVIHRLLNRRPNTYETAAQFRYRLSAQTLLSRKGAFIEIVRDNGGRATELHLLPPNMVEPIPDPKKFVSGYRIRDVENNIIDLKPEDVIWVRVKPHPTDAYAQMTPLVAAGLAVDTDYLARLFNRNFLAKDGRPGTLISVQGQINPQDAEELKRRFSGGPMSAGEATVIEADGVTVNDLSATPHDVQYVEGIRGTKEDILLAFGVAESVLGNASGRTFDNADAEREGFWLDTMVNHVTALDSAYDVLTPGGNDDDQFVTHDLEQVDILQRAKRLRHDKALNEFLQGTMTLDQYLEEVGRPTLNVPASRVFWGRQGLVPFGANDEDTKAAAALQVVGMAAPTDPGASAQAGARTGAYAGIQAAQRQIMNDTAARALRLAASNGQTKRLRLVGRETKTSADKESHTPVDVRPTKHKYDAERTRIEAEIEGLLNAWSSRQQRAVSERLGGTKERKYTRHWDGEPGTKALNAERIVDVDRWTQDIVDSMEPVFRQIAERWAVKAARELRRTGVIDAMFEAGEGNPGARNAVDMLTGGGVLGRESVIGSPTQAALDIVRQSARRQAEHIVDTIKQMDANGASIRQINDAINTMVDSRSSWKKSLSVSAATAVVEGSRNAVYNHAGRFVARKWITMHDERVRPSHGAAHGQVREGGKPFQVGRALLMHPGDPTAPVEETANCRCWTEFVPVKAPKKPTTARNRTHAGARS